MATHPYLGLAFLTGLNLFNYLDRYVLAAVLRPLQNELHLNDTQGDARSANTAFMIGYFRHLADLRVSRRPFRRANG